MPTLVAVDGFEHEVLLATKFGGLDGEGVWDTVTNSAAFSFITGRTGGKALRMTATGTTSALVRRHAGTDVAVGSASFYVRFPGSLPAAFSLLWGFQNTASPHAVLAYASATQKFNLTWSTAYNAAGDFGPTLAADTWYLIDLKLDVSANPRVFTGKVDGGTEVAVNQASAATTIQGWGPNQYGTTATVTVDFDDFVASDTLDDYPMGAHVVEMAVPVSDDTTTSVYGTNVMEQGTGTDLSSSNQGYQYLDDWPTTNPGAINAADHVTQAATGATNQVTVNMTETAETVWGAMAYALLGSDATTSNDGTTRVKYSDATTLNVYAGDMSETAAHHRTIILDAAKVDSSTEFNGLQMQVGFSGDAAPDPEWRAVMIEFAYSTTAAGGDQDLTGTVFTKAGTFPQGTIAAVYDLAGAVFTKAGTFPQGAITAVYDLTGTTFQKAGTFPQGTIAAEGGDQTLSGATFTKAGTFPQGAVTSSYDLAGTVFTKAGTFPQGAVTSVFTLTGVTFQKAGTFPQGAVTPGDVTLTGAVFQKAGTFPQGAVSLGGAPDQGLTGAVFQKAGTFPQGTVESVYPLAGVTFTKAGTFPQGAITSAFTITGVTFAKAGTFPTGAITGGAVTLVGVTFTRAGTFPVGLVSIGVFGTPVEYGTAVDTTSPGGASVDVSEGHAIFIGTEGTA